jgi:hypothetical protein
MGMRSLLVLVLVLVLVGVVGCAGEGLEVEASDQEIEAISAQGCDSSSEQAGQNSTSKAECVCVRWCQTFRSFDEGDCNHLAATQCGTIFEYGSPYDKKSCAETCDPVQAAVDLDCVGASLTGAQCVACMGYPEIAEWCAGQ